LALRYRRLYAYIFATPLILNKYTLNTTGSADFPQYRLTPLT